MKIDKKTLERLSNLELKYYAGDLNAIKGIDKTLYDTLLEQPVEVQIVAKKGVCDDKLYEICLSLSGRHEKFVDLRHGIMDKLLEEFEPPGWNLLSVLFDGIYVGEPEDLLNYREGNISKILYPIKGLGEKLAETRFLDKD